MIILFFCNFIETKFQQPLFSFRLGQSFV